MQISVLPKSIQLADGPWMITVTTTQLNSNLPNFVAGTNVFDLQVQYEWGVHHFNDTPDAFLAAHTLPPEFIIFMADHWTPGIVDEDVPEIWPEADLIEVLHSGLALADRMEFETVALSMPRFNEGRVTEESTVQVIHALKTWTGEYPHRVNVYYPDPRQVALMRLKIERWK